MKGGVMAGCRQRTEDALQNSVLLDSRIRICLLHHKLEIPARYAFHGYNWVAMKLQQKRSGDQTGWKVASRKSKNMKQNYGKLNSNKNFASYKPQCKQSQGYLRTENKKRRNLFETNKTILLEGSPVCAPCNTSSDIIKSKKCGRISNCSASGGFITQDDEQCGVDAYGSMKAFWRIRHKSQQNTGDFETRLDRCIEIRDEKVERRFDEDLSRFEMIYPSKYEICPRVLETRINEQDDQIAYLEEEGTSLRERVNNMEQGIDSLKLRMRVLEVANAFKSTEILSGEASFA
ncbi:hypothetical protein SUGI_1107070 [Cryptomeria japonica]|nr:hypothetical protein SUGI_1107070 [Cryptomeria japonica]